MMTTIVNIILTNFFSAEYQSFQAGDIGRLDETSKGRREERPINFSIIDEPSNIIHSVMIRRYAYTTPIAESSEGVRDADVEHVCCKLQSTWLSLEKQRLSV